MKKNYEMRKKTIGALCPCVFRCVRLPSIAQGLRPRAVDYKAMGCPSVMPI